MSIHFFLKLVWYVCKPLTTFFHYHTKEIALAQERKVSLSRNSKWMKNSRQVHNSCNCQ